MAADGRPLPDDIDALMQLISGRAADRQTMRRLVNCDLVEEFHGTCLLTIRGIEAAALLSSSDPTGQANCPRARSSFYGTDDHSRSRFPS